MSADWWNGVTYCDTIVNCVLSHSADWWVKVTYCETIVKCVLSDSADWWVEVASDTVPNCIL